MLTWQRTVFSAEYQDAAGYIIPGAFAAKDEISSNSFGLLYESAHLNAIPNLGRL